jgi:prevent-host-death family protein
MESTAKKLRFNTKEILDTVSRGEEVIIIFRGKPCAKLVPVESKSNKENNLFGIWKDNKNINNVKKHVRKIRKGRFQ